MGFFFYNPDKTCHFILFFIGDWHIIPKEIEMCARSFAVQLLT